MTLAHLWRQVSRQNVKDLPTTLTMSHRLSATKTGIICTFITRITVITILPYCEWPAHRHVHVIYTGRWRHRWSTAADQSATSDISADTRRTWWWSDNMAQQSAANDGRHRDNSWVSLRPTTASHQTRGRRVRGSDVLWDFGLIYTTGLTAMCIIFSERELKFMFAICHRPSVCRLSVTLVHPTQAIEIFGNVSTP